MWLSTKKLMQRMYSGAKVAEYQYEDGSKILLCGQDRLTEKTVKEFERMTFADVIGSKEDDIFLRHRLTHVWVLPS